MMHKINHKTQFAGIILLTFKILLGCMYVGAQDDKIIEYEERSQKYASHNDLRNAAEYLNRIAFIYWDRSEPDQAVAYFLRSAEYNRLLGNLNAVKSIYSNISMIYADAGQADKSLEYAHKSLEIRKQLRKHGEIVTGLLEVATLLESQGKYSESNDYLLQAEAMAASASDLNLPKNIYGLLATNYKHLGKYDLYQEYSDKYSALRQHLIEEQFREKEAESMKRIKDISQTAEGKIEAKQNELSQMIDSLLVIDSLSKQRKEEIALLNREKQDKEAEILQTNARLQKTTKFAVLIGLVMLLMLGMAIMLFRGYKNKQLINKRLAIQNEEIQKQHDEIARQRDDIQQQHEELETALGQIRKHNVDITNSIAYAKRIQTAMMPGEEALRELVPESFIIFRPREMVSGDFYWFKGIESMAKVTKYLLSESQDLSPEEYDRLNRTFMIGAIDCTGHGVPGAFMSMIGFNLLNEITAKGAKSSGSVLNQLHKAVRAALRQDTTDNHDGMDAALCMVDPMTRTIDFAGAKNPLIYFVNGHIEIIEGDKNPIGGIQREEKRKFNSHKICVDKPITCYIFTDGFQDQFGGPKGRKFMKNNLYALLTEIHELPMSQQKERLIKEFETWKGENKQIDDVLLIGFRLQFDH